MKAGYSRVTEGEIELEHNSKLRLRSQVLRKQMTKEERHLWYDFLKGYPLPIKRQHMIGNFIVDFYCHKARLAIELDGSQHYTPEGIAYDLERTAYLEGIDIMVLRFFNQDVMDGFPSVCQTIDAWIRQRSSRCP